MKRTFKAAALELAGAFALLGTATPAHAVTMVELQMGAFAIENGVFNVVFAKEVCSCMFVDGLTLQDCTDPIRDNLPSIATSLVNISVDPVGQTVSSSYKGADEINVALASLGIAVASVGGPAAARYDSDRFGCVLTELPASAAQPVTSPSLDGGTDVGIDPGAEGGVDPDAATDAAAEDGGGEAAPVTTAPSCGSLVDGQYCGSDGIEDGDPATLYACAGGTLSTVEVCANGCLADFGMDSCN